jgi:hypothetical protein
MLNFLENIETKKIIYKLMYEDWIYLIFFSSQYKIIFTLYFFIIKFIISFIKI